MPHSSLLSACCGFLLVAGAAAAQTTLPDAPASHLAQPGPLSGPHQAIIPEYSRWSGVVEPGQKIRSMSVHDKLLFPLHEEAEWTTAIPILFSAEYGVLTDDDPKYGSNGKAFAERMGAEALFQADTRLLSDGFLPILFHEDPRYYRQAYGTYTSRTEHAVRRIFISQRDSGTRTFNFSDVLGRGIGAALTQTYYPSQSVSYDVVLRTWGVSLLALGGGNLFEEFWPDVKYHVFHRR